MHGDEIAGEEQRQPDHAADNQRAIGDHLRHRPRQHERAAQSAQTHTSDEEHHQRMQQDAVAERPAVAERAEAESAESPSGRTTSTKADERPGGVPAARRLTR